MRKRAEEPARGPVEEAERLRARNAELKRQLDDMRGLAMRDQLTGLFSRHYLTDYLEHEIARASRESNTVLALCDIDDFKTINDVRGHQAGDIAIACIADILDDLAGGQSTFMVEMSEVAEILRQATAHSLLILDEIGRGTSTFDGMSIARAVLEFCADRKRLGAKTLFATHYHELTELEGTLAGVKNYNIAIKKRGEDLVFLRKIIPGGADRSYGIEVAKLAGLPKEVVSRAKKILEELEAGGSYIPPREEREQVSLDAIGEAEVLDALRRAQLDTMSPIEAMQLLYDLKKKLPN